MSSYRLVIGGKRHSSWSLRPWLVLRELALPFAEIVVPLYQAATPAAIRRYSPSGRVPVLFDGDFCVWDSLAILEYLAERHPERGVWPGAPRARARARSLAAEMHSSFPALRAELPFAAGQRRPGLSFSAEAAAEVARIKEIIAGTRAEHGQGGAFLFGRFGAADAMYAPVMFRFATYGIPIDGPVEAYLCAMLALPGMRDWSEAARESAI